MKRLVAGSALIALAVFSARAEELRVTTLYRTGTLTKSVGSANLVVRDVAGDARPEIVSCSNGFAFAMSYDGTTYHDVWYSTPVQCSAVAVGDRNHSGRNSVFVGTSAGYYNQAPSYLYAFDATSYGPELAKVQVSATDGVNDIAIGNVDADSDLEIAVVTANNLYVFNAATFALEWTAPYGGRKVAIADLEGDGLNEIIVDGTDGHVLNAYTKTYKWGYVGGFGTTMAVGDVDNDGKAEIIAGTTSNVKIINGDTMTTSTISKAAQTVAVGDANNDGLNELIIGPDQWGSVEGYTASGTKLWGIANPEHGVQGMTVGDPDGDGANEILWGAGATSSGADTLMIGNANNQTIEYRGADLDGPFRTIVTDLNGDGRLEMIVTSGSTESGYSGSAAFVFDYQTRKLLAKLAVSSNFNITRVAIGQVDGDAAREIVLLGSSYYTGAIQVFDGATFALEWSSPTPPCCSQQISTYGLIVKDIDGDGIDEIIYATSDRKIQVLNGATPFIKFTSGALDNPIYDMKIADLDGDGVLDLVVGTYSGLYVFKTSDWSQRTYIPLAGSYRNVAATPGHLGVTLSGGGVAMYSGTTLTQEWICPSGNDAVDLAFVTLAGRSRLALLKSDATIRFFPTTGTTCPVYDTISHPVAGTYGPVMSFADLDGDGRPELLTGSGADLSISVLGWSSEPRGDVNLDGVVTDADIDALAAYFYGSGAAAQPGDDVNADGAIRPDDLFYLINYRRGTGAPPPQ